MSWEQLELELAEMFDEYTWRADDYQQALELRAAQVASSRREYMREYMREYNKIRKAKDPGYQAALRKASREAMRRNHAAKLAATGRVPRRARRPRIEDERAAA